MDTHPLDRHLSKCLQAWWEARWKKVSSSRDGALGLRCQALTLISSKQSRGKLRLRIHMTSPKAHSGKEASDFIQQLSLNSIYCTLTNAHSTTEITIKVKKIRSWVQETFVLVISRSGEQKGASSTAFMGH